VGRDKQAKYFDDEYDVSIHTPAWGVTEISTLSRTATKSFNPHARVGRDENTNINANNVLRFNPHARVGRDGHILLLSTATIEFQSTRPRGA